MRLAALVACALACASPAAAQRVMLNSGQAITVTLDDRGTHVSDKRPTALTPFDTHTIDELRGARKDGDGGAVLVKGSADAPPAIVSDTVTIRFVAGDKDSVLIVENGYAKGMIFHARITMKRETVPTDICLTRPGKPGYSLWTARIERIELTSFRLEPWKEGDPLPCER